VHHDLQARATAVAQHMVLCKSSFHQEIPKLNKSLEVMKSKKDEFLVVNLLLTTDNEGLKVEVKKA